jgi:hypothetical protein
MDYNSLLRVNIYLDNDWTTLLHVIFIITTIINIF